MNKLQVQLTPEERRLFKVYAVKHGTTMSDLIRGYIQSVTTEPKKG